jgi:hypothetical protein
VIHEQSSTRILLAIELDDRTHERPERQRRDAFLDNALASAGIGLVRIPAASRYDAAELEQLMKQKMGRARSSRRPSIQSAGKRDKMRAIRDRTKEA